MLSKHVKEKLTELFHINKECLPIAQNKIDGCMHFMNTDVVNLEQATVE
jgi:hypothetical protein